MERPELRLVRDDRSRAGIPAATGIAAITLVGAAIATVVGADAARAPSRASSLAAEAGRAALEHGADDARAREALVELRREVGRRPRDGATRATYAAALLDSAGETAAAREAAAFHASRAAADAPVSVPVVASATRTLARCGRAESAVPLVRSTFGCAPAAGATLLLELEAYLPDAEARALPDRPAAWSAWGLALRRSGRREEGTRRLELTVARWPDEADSRRLASLVAAAEGRWDDLDRLVPERPADATLLALRARLLARRGDRAGAAETALAAVRASDGAPAVRELAGSALLDAGEIAAAREAWERALWSLPATAGTRATRLRLRLALARLERDHGRAGDALRAWRAVLEIDPSNAEALRATGK